MKTVIIVSTGRCGTKRITQILNDHLQGSGIRIVHQQGISRLSNVLGNFKYYGFKCNLLDNLLYRKLRGDESSTAILTDPLISGVIPLHVMNDSATMIVHLTREDISFAESMFKLSRSRYASFIAHNFIPLWQPYLWPLENLLNSDILTKYSLISSRKNAFFVRRYSQALNYHHFTYEEVFKDKSLFEMIGSYLGVPIDVTDAELQKRQ